MPWELAQGPQADDQPQLGSVAQEVEEVALEGRGARVLESVDDEDDGDR